MAVVLLFSTEFPPQDVGTLAASPFLNPACLSLVVVIAGLVAAGVLVPVRWLRSGFAGLGILLDCVGIRLPGDRRGPRRPTGRAAARRGRDRPRAGAAPGRRALRGDVEPRPLRTVRHRWRGRRMDCGGPVRDDHVPRSDGLGPDHPAASCRSRDERALVAALLAGAALVAARWLAPMALRRIAVIAAITTVAWVVPFEVYADMVVVLWVAACGRRAGGDALGPPGRHRIRGPRLDPLDRRRWGRLRDRRASRPPVGRGHVRSGASHRSSPCGRSRSSPSPSGRTWLRGTPCSPGGGHGSR